MVIERNKVTECSGGALAFPKPTYTERVPDGGDMPEDEDYKEILKVLGVDEKHYKSFGEKLTAFFASLNEEERKLIVSSDPHDPRAKAIAMFSIQLTGKALEDFVKAAEKGGSESVAGILVNAKGRPYK